MRGTLVKRHRHGKGKQECHFMLFDDIVLYTRLRMGKLDVSHLRKQKLTKLRVRTDFTQIT